MNQEQINKPFSIPRQLIFDAWKGVKENRGSAGIDAVSIKELLIHIGQVDDVKNLIFTSFNRQNK